MRVCVCVCVCVARAGQECVFSVGPAMYAAVRKLFFADCRCEGGDGSKTYEELFARLDANKDGRVDVSELKAGLAAMGIRTGKGAAQVESRAQQNGVVKRLLWGRESSPARVYCVLDGIPERTGRAAAPPVATMSTRLKSNSVYLLQGFSPSTVLIYMLLYLYFY